MKRADIAMTLAALAMTGLAGWRMLQLIHVPLPPSPQIRTPNLNTATIGPRRTVVSAASWRRSLFARETVAGPSDQPKPSGSAPPAGLPRLVGVIMEGDTKLAVIAYNGAIHRVRETKTIGEWTVSLVTPRSVSVRANERSETLQLDP